MAGIPKPSEIQGQIHEMQGHKSSLEQNKAGIKEALGELRSRSKEIDSNIAEMEARMDQDFPAEFKAQLSERIAMLKNAKKQIESQIGDLEGKLAMMTEAAGSLNTAISARKNLLQQLAGAMARQVPNLVNRELGRQAG